jgi:hypothetical protein
MLEIRSNSSLLGQAYNYKFDSTFTYMLLFKSGCKRKGWIERRCNGRAC